MCWLWDVCVVCCGLLCVVCCFVSFRFVLFCDVCVIVCFVCFVVVCRVVSRRAVPCLCLLWCSVVVGDGCCCCVALCWLVLFG